MEARICENVGSECTCELDAKHFPPWFQKGKELKINFLSFYVQMKLRLKILI